MGSMSAIHWLLVAAVVLLLFGGRGKVSALMGDFGKGLQAFKKGVGGGQTEETPPSTAAQPGDAAKPIAAQATTTAPGTVHQDTAAKV